MNTAAWPPSPRDDGFREALQHTWRSYLKREADRFDPAQRLQIDLHCHDRNSDQPDELWGRILRLPETWLKTGKLVQCLRDNGSTALTITNHNNARSCWKLLERGEDVLVGAEFTCHFPDIDLSLHVLTYGFSPEQEVVLNRKRRDVYAFLRYAAEHNLPTVLPHPLYQYAQSGKINPEVYARLALLFQRFEVLNGQRDLWQSVLTLHWIEGLSAERLHDDAKRLGINPRDFGVDIERPKALTGGSDDHMGIFAGQCGTWLEVPDLANRLQNAKPSELALEALRQGRTAPFGHVGENDKLNIALLDYFSQVANRIEDPGLLRILLHRGEWHDKLACLTIANGLLELQKSAQARKFFDLVHAALQGRKPGKLLNWKVPKSYRFCLRHLERIADSRRADSETFVATVNHAINDLFTQLNRIMVEQVRASGLITQEPGMLRFSSTEITRRFELPAQLSVLLGAHSKAHTRNSDKQLRALCSQLSFPLLVSAVLSGATIASTRLLYQNRDFLNRFAGMLGEAVHAKRALHLTDTLFDRNGVSTSLQRKLRQLQRYDLPIDFLICHEHALAEPHLHVLRPLASVTLPDASAQRLRLPNLLEAARVFYEGGYDRVVCSTEGPMVLVALMLKYKFNVPAYFFMHTDWIEYLRCTGDSTPHERDRLRRLLRFLYQQFDGIFVLNSEHRDWLCSHDMGLDPQRVMLTAHQAPSITEPVTPIQKCEILETATAQTPTLLFAGRLSREKGLLDLPEIMRRVKAALPDVQLVIAGSGPDETLLREQLPEAHFLGWVEQDSLAGLYAGLDLLVFPSRFDTFGNAVLEAMTHGMPVAAYANKGPRDLIEHGQSGYLADSAAELATCIIAHFRGTGGATAAAARSRAERYRPESLLTEYLEQLGLMQETALFDTAEALL